MLHVVAMKDGEKTKLVEGMIIWLALSKETQFVGTLHIWFRGAGTVVVRFNLSYLMSSTSSGTTLRGNFCNKTKSIFCSLVVITLHPHGAWNT
jgi:hypothetical protein